MPTKLNEDRLAELLMRWDELHRQGCDVTAQELCTDCPELVEELARRIEAVGKMDSVLDIEDTAGPSNPSDQGPNGASAKRKMPDVLRASAEYRPQRHHAHGGLGEILIADEHELGRPVALKRIRPDKLHDKARHRFLREAAITARLQHPGIVPIYGLGQDDDGPFYTMPFIRGQTLQEAIDGFQSDGSLRGDPGRRSLKFRGLLQQFITVCNTMAYAHDQGIVHRDLKPSNIMLGPYGETLVMDWGLAKPFDRDGSVSESDGDAPSPGLSPEDLTATGIVLGTPHYMSPEQARGEPAGPASDIFSLGLILYAILTGKSAFDEATDSLKAVSEAPVVPPRHRDPSLPHALEAICLKALPARPEDRYPSARTLAEDVTKWLADEPVTAWREGWPVRGRRWTKRHRTLVAAAVVALLAGVVALGVVAGVQAQAKVRLRDAYVATNRALAETRKAQAETQSALAQSEESRKQAEAVSTFLVEAFRSPDPSQDGRQVKVADVLDRASERLDKGFAGSQATLGALISALGNTYQGLGLYDRAVSLHTRARAVRETALGPDHRDTLMSRNNLANAYRDAGRFPEAIALHEATLKLREATLGSDHSDTLTSRNNLAAAYQDDGRTSEAIALYEATVKLREATQGPDHHDTLTSRNNLALAYGDAGRTSEAIALFEATLKLSEVALGPDHLDTLWNRNNLASAYDDVGRTSEAITLYEATLERMETALGRDHPELLKSRNGLAAAYYHAGRMSEATALFEETLELREAKLGLDHPLTLDSRNNLAAAYTEAGRLTKAITLFEETLKLREAKLGSDHLHTLGSRGNLAEAYFHAGRLSEAIPMYEETLKQKEARLGPDHPATLDGRNNLALAYASLGRWAEAEYLLRDVLAHRRTTDKPASPLLAGDLAALGHHLLAQSRWSEAEPLLRECLTIREKATPDDWSRYDAMSLLGGILLGQGRYTEAEPLVVPGYEGMKAREARISVSERNCLREAAERIVHLYEAWNKPDQAAAWKAKLGMPDLPADVFARP